MSTWHKRTSIQFKYKGRRYEADIDMAITSESNYGADADGHRGIYAEFIDDIVCTEIRSLKHPWEFWRKPWIVVNDERIENVAFALIDDGKIEIDTTPDYPEIEGGIDEF